jgi:hypothetical protein
LDIHAIKTQMAMLEDGKSGLGFAKVAHTTFCRSEVTTLGRTTRRCLFRYRIPVSKKAGLFVWHKPAKAFKMI